MSPKGPSLESELVSRVKTWLALQAQRVRDDDVQASIKFTLGNSFSDDDGTLILALRVEENVEDYLDEEIGLRVEGVPFSPDAPRPGTLDDLEEAGL